MIQRNSIEPLPKYELYEQVKEKQNVLEEFNHSFDEEYKDKVEYEVNNNDKENEEIGALNKEKNNKKKIKFFSFQLMLSVTIAVLFFVINTFTPNLYHDLINFFKEEISIQTDFKEDTENAIAIIKSAIAN